jgi:pimeloyl-ACP methyl ester carboxylesterase
MASDVLALMDHLHIQKAALIGWSDGGIIGLKIALHHPERLTKLFAYGANSYPAGVKDTTEMPAFTAYVARVKGEYQALSPTPDQYQTFLNDISVIWDQRHFTAKELQQISVPTWIVAGDHGAIKKSDTDFLFEQIPNAEELILPGVGHFAFIQRPNEFNAALQRFLRWQPPAQQGGQAE